MATYAVTDGKPAKVESSETESGFDGGGTMPLLLPVKEGVLVVLPVVGPLVPLVPVDMLDAVKAVVAVVPVVGT